MTVIVGYDKSGNAIYRSITGVGSSEDDRERAIKLDQLIKDELNELDVRLKKSRNKSSSGSKNKVEAYWEFGVVLRKILSRTELISPSEKALFWLNVKNHAPKKLLAKDRGPNRIHVEYCFRLAYYPKEIALKREWSEWVYLFDSPFVNNEMRFEKWDLNKIKNKPEKIGRDLTRLFIQCLNSILNNVNTNDLNENELYRCYDGAWLLSSSLIADFRTNKKTDFKFVLKKVISEKRIYIGKLMKGEIEINDFCKIIINQIFSSFN